MMRPVLRISRAQFRENLAAVRARIAPGELMLVMKDDAYGHGIAWSAAQAAADGVGWFGSFDIRTGLAIRDATGPESRVFAWTTSPDDEVHAALAARLDLGVGTPAYLERVLAAAATSAAPARVHLKIDTGLHRNGFLPEEWDAAVARLRQAEAQGIAECVGVWSHLAEASDDDDDRARDVFVAAVQDAGAPAVQHLTASAASWWRPELRGTHSRIGAFCYGIRSADGPDLDGIAPIARLEAPVTGLNDDTVTIAVGSGHGLPSTLAGCAVGTPAGARALTEIGFVTSTVQAWPGAAIGDTVIVFGPGRSGESTATTLAERIDTVGEEIVTRLTRAVKRVVVYGF